MRLIIIKILFLMILINRASARNYWKALKLYEERNFKAALYHFKLALDKEQEYKDDIIFYIASCYLKLGEKSKAIQCFEKLIKISESRHSLYKAWFGLGIVYYESSDYKNAAKCFKKAIKIDPQSKAAYYNLGISLYMLGRYEEALSYLRISENVENATELINEIEKKLALKERESLRTSGRGNSNFDSNFQPPLDVLHITSDYGEPRHYGKHQGIDLRAPYRSPVYAIADAVVVFAGRDGGYGNKIILKHRGDTLSVYAHLDEILVSEGQKVNRGDIIGRVGYTGNAKGPHLHFETRVNNKNIDPKIILKDFLKITTVNRF